MFFIFLFSLFYVRCNCDVFLYFFKQFTHSRDYGISAVTYFLMLNIHYTGYNCILKISSLHLSLFSSFFFQSALTEDWQTATSIYDFSATDIDGNVISLEKYR